VSHIVQIGDYLFCSPAYIFVERDSNIKANEDCCSAVPIYTLGYELHLVHLRLLLRGEILPFRSGIKLER